jgi:hypothetical protein
VVSDHDRIVTIEETVKWIRAKLEEGDDTMDDHKRRIRKLEMFQAKLIGVAIAASAGISVVVVWIQKIFGSGS